MALSMLIAMVGIITDQLILVIGAMIVGPEFGPIAGLCVAIVHKQREVAKRSFMALAIGFPLGITAVFGVALAIDATGLLPSDFTQEGHPFTDFISNPDFYSFLVAAFAGIAGMLSLTSAKSGALIGVLVSVTTIPAAANIGLAAAYGDWEEWRGAMEQLSLNLSTILAVGMLTLYVQRLLYVRRRRRRLHHEAREIAGLPVGQSRQATMGSGRPEADRGG
jgi:uncharacterized hydrophobic protein (TIGR00271 family)